MKDYTPNPIAIQATKAIVSKYFKDSIGEPFPLTDGEAMIFHSVTDPYYKWVWDSAPTRYGKTETIAMAIIYLASILKLKVPIVGGSEDKAKKIMEYVVQHLGDNRNFYTNLINIQDVHDVDKLKVTVSKDALRWRDGGWIYITSVDSRGISSEGEKVVGEGGDVVILEEAGLIRRKEQFSKVVRMSELNKGWGKLVMSGNCFEKSVFEDAYNDPLYYKVRISLEQAIAEGRYTQQELDEKKPQTTSKDWKRLYLVEFPQENEFTYFKPTKYEFLPKGLKYYGAVDLALGESLKGSLVGIVILGKDKAGQVYEVDSIGELLKPEETIRRIFNFPYTFERFGVESVQFQKYFLQNIKAKSQAEERYIPFEGIDQKRKKEERIESLEPMINTGQILFKGDNELWNEMQDYPMADHLDVIDALEMTWRLCSTGTFRYAFV